MLLNEPIQLVLRKEAQLELMMHHTEHDIAISIKGLNVWFEHFHALKDVDLEVKSGEIVVVFGPSGSGKSTLARCINHLEQYQEGEISIFGKSLANKKKAAEIIRQDIGMVFQYFHLFPHLSILENCTLGLIKIKGIAPKEANALAMQLLTRVDVAHLAHQYPGQISGGQKQRVAIARALVMKPKILLMDEPTSALDPEMIKEVLDVMIDLAKEGITMLCVTHEMGFASQVADKVVFMVEGNIVETGPPEHVLVNPQWDRTHDFLTHILDH